MSSALRTSWTAAELSILNGAGSIWLAAQKDQSEAPERVEVGFVVVDREVFVRAYRGVSSRWYRAAMSIGQGVIWLDEALVQVTFSPGPVAERTALTERIDAAYLDKYGSASALVTTDAVRNATVRISRREPTQRGSQLGRLTRPKTGDSRAWLL